MYVLATYHAKETINHPHCPLILFERWLFAVHKTGTEGHTFRARTRKIEMGDWIKEVFSNFIL
jgi:hypothetical protein